VISWLLVALSLFAQSAGPQSSTTLDVTIAPGANYDKADFRLWLPPNVAKVRAIVVLIPGSNGDGRPMADDKFWQDFAVAQKVALVACRFTDKPHDQGFIEEYVNVSKGSGQAFLDAISQLASQSHHPELVNSQLLLWGMSAGGEFNYEFVAWKPERVAAFIVNKGGIYYSSLLSKASRAVPGILFTGDADLDSRQFTVKGLFGVNRRSGALWALAEEPGLGHVVGSSQKLGALLFSEVLDAAPGTITENNGYLGNIHSFEIVKRSDLLATKDISSWFLTERLAKAWQEAVKK